MSCMNCWLRNMKQVDEQSETSNVHFFWVGVEWFKCVGRIFGWEFQYNYSCVMPQCELYFVMIFLQTCIHNQHSLCIYSTPAQECGNDNSEMNETHLHSFLLSIAISTCTMPLCACPPSMCVVYDKLGMLFHPSGVVSVMTYSCMIAFSM